MDSNFTQRSETKQLLDIAKRSVFHMLPVRNTLLEEYLSSFVTTYDLCLSIGSSFTRTLLKIKKILKTSRKICMSIEIMGDSKSLIPLFPFKQDQPLSSKGDVTSASPSQGNSADSFVFSVIPAVGFRGLDSSNRRTLYLLCCAGESQEDDQHTPLEDDGKCIYEGAWNI
jgi:hypothetical protein